MGKALYYTCAMMNRTLVKHVLDSEEEMPDVLIQGWVRTRRDSKAFSFLEVMTVPPSPPCRSWRMRVSPAMNGLEKWLRGLP